MATRSLNLIADIASRKLLASLGSKQSAATPGFVQGDNLAVEFHAVTLSDSFSTPTPETAIPASAVVILALGTPGAQPIAQAVLSTALQNNLGRSGLLSLNTAEVEAFLAGAASKAATLEIEMTEVDGTVTTLAQVACTVINDLIAVGGTPPAAVPALASQVAANSAAIASIQGGILISPTWANLGSAPFATCTLTGGIPTTLATSNTQGSAAFVELAIPTWGVATLDLTGALIAGTATNCTQFLTFLGAGGEVLPAGGRIALTLGASFSHLAVAVPVGATKVAFGVETSNGGLPHSFASGFSSLAVVARANITTLTADALAAILADKAQAQSDAATIAALVSPAQSDAAAAQQAKNDAQAAAEGLMGSSWDATIRDEYVGLPVVRFASHSSNGATGYMFGTGAEASCDGTLKSISTRVGTAGAASVVVGRLQKDGKFAPRSSHGITLVAGVTEYAVGAPILKGETIFLLCVAGTLTYNPTASGRTYFSYATGAAPTAEVTTSKNAGASVALGFTVSGYGSEFDISPSAFSGYTVPSGWTLAGGVLTAGGANGDTDGRRCVCGKKYYAKRRAWEFDILFNGSTVQFGFAALSAWGKTGTTLGIDSNGRAFALYEARDGWGSLTQQSASVIPSAFDFGTKCHVRLVRHDRTVSCSITDANGVTASVVSAYPSGDYLADAGSWVGVYSAGWASDQPFFTWYAAGTGPAISAPSHTIIGHSPLLFMGDSITEGYGCAGDTWAELAAAKLGLRATLLARSGCTVGDLLACEELNWVKPRVAVVSIGANGGNTEALLTQLVLALKARGAAKVILCRYPTALNAAGNAAVDASAAANSLITPPRFDVVTANAAGTALDAGYECGDAIHPNEAGQARMAAALADALGRTIGAIR